MSLFPRFSFQHCRVSLCMLRRAGLLLCEDEKLTISPSLRVRINPLKTSQILAPRSATLGLTTGGNYTFCFLFSHQTAHRPGREHTHAPHKAFHVILAARRSLHASDTQATRGGKRHHRKLTGKRAATLAGCAAKVSS